MKIRLLLGVAAAVMLASSAHAGTKKDIDNKSTFTTEDAVRGQVYVNAAMNTPMMDLLQKADVHHPDIMLEYGLALDLGRTSVSQQMPKDDREKLKRGFRAMLDLYLNKSDKFDITFDEDAMLDQSEFWIYLAKHVGRAKPRSQMPNISVPDMGSQQETMPMQFVPDDPNQDKEFNLNQDLVLKPNVVNAAATCAQSAFGFARMKKTQMIDISATKLTPEQFAQAQDTAVKTYRMAWSEGIMACGSREYFQTAASFSAQNLGVLGTMKENPDAKLSDLPTN